MKKYIIGNHKNYKYEESLIESISSFPTSVNIIVCPQIIFLKDFQKFKEINLGIQKISSIPEIGDITCTGELNMKVLESLNVKYAIVGHNERRTLGNATQDELRNELSNCVKNNITPIFCVGQQKDESIDILKDQLNIYNAFKNSFKEKIVAFEPASAIGSGNLPSIEKIKTAVKLIKDFVGEDVAVLYGGSINSENSKEIFDETEGLLIGKASLSEEFYKVIKKVL